MDHPWAMNPDPEPVQAQVVVAEPEEPLELFEKNEFVRMCRRHTSEAIAILVKGLKSKSEKTQIRCAERLLDRAWGKPKEEIEVGISHNISAEAVIAALMETQGDVYLDADGQRSGKAIRPLPSQLLGLPGGVYPDSGPGGPDPARETVSSALGLPEGDRG